MILPIFMVLLSAMLEFGFAFSDRLTLGNATREGARIGSALVTGQSTSCSGDPAGVDKTIVASVQHILKSGGSDVDLAHVTSIKIFKATASGGQTSGKVNTWVYTPGAGPDADPGTAVETLDFSPTTTGWNACSRVNSAGSPDSIGVSIDYSYQLKTPLQALLNLINGTQSSSIRIVFTTVMAMNPTA
jgi:hypothetical protein